MTTILITLAGGLGLFIAGMNMMSRGIEKVAGTKLRAILAAFTRTKLLGILVGAFFTAVIQSSGATTVMVVSFVNSGLMDLTQAVSIVLGANIGTSVTALLVAIRLSAVAPLFVLLGAFMAEMVRNPKVRKIGEIVLGFGILFVGISTMSSAMSSLREVPAVVNVLSGFSNPAVGLLLGLVITAIVQSSSVTTSILVVMAAQGLMELYPAMFVILGCNIGACMPSLLAGRSAGKNGKRASLLYLIFNLFASTLWVVLLLIFPAQIQAAVRFIAGTGTDAGSLGRSIAFANLLFKVGAVAVSYPLTGVFIRIAGMLVTGEDDPNAAKGFRTQFIGKKLPNPTVGTYLAVQEMDRMAQMAFQNLNLAVECFIEGDTERAEEVSKTEEYIDFLAVAISDYLVRINQNTLPLADMRRIAAYFHVVGDIERIGDHAQTIVEAIPQMVENGAKLSDESAAEMRGMMTAVNKILRESLDMFVTGDNSKMDEIRKLENDIDGLERELQSAHIVRLSEGKCSAFTGVFFNDVVSGLERVSDHAINIAFSLNEALGYVPQS